MVTTVQYKSDLDTPCLILDMDILERNLQKMQSVVEHAGKNLRPHAKTHKCSALAKKQISTGAIGVCVAKISEAEALVKAGVDNILITGPVVTRSKVERLLNLLPAITSLMIVVDNTSNIELLDTVLGPKGRSIGVLLDLDVGLNRTGVKSADALALAEKIVASQNLHLRGIQAYAGHIQHILSYDTRKHSSYQCMREAVHIFKKLRSTIPTCKIFSATGTGTFDIDLAIPEITELQVGSYVLMDAEYLAIESAESDTRFESFEPALRLLTTVISVNHEGFVTVDAGLKSLYQDGGKPQVIVPCSTALEYSWFGDEYGKITSTNNSELPPLGAVLELITSHCDPTINLFDKYYLTRGNEVVGTWSIDLRGCSQ